MQERTQSRPIAKHRDQRELRGFSLIEVMIAMAILGFGLLGILFVQAEAMGQSSKGNENTVALAAARDVFEQLPRIPFTALPADGDWKAPAWIVNPGLNGGDPDLAPGVVGERLTDGSDTNHFKQLYRVWYRVDDDPAATPNPRVRSVEVEVIWNDANDVAVTPATRTTDRFVRLSGLIVDNDL